jgi:hypothetical protein
VLFSPGVLHFRIAKILFYVELNPRLLIDLEPMLCTTPISNIKYLRLFLGFLLSLLQRNVIVLEYLRGAHKACPSPEIGTAYSI